MTENVRREYTLKTVMEYEYHTTVVSEPPRRRTIMLKRDLGRFRLTLDFPWVVHVTSTFRNASRLGDRTGYTQDHHVFMAIGPSFNNSETNIIGSAPAGGHVCFGEEALTLMHCGKLDPVTAYWMTEFGGKPVLIEAMVNRDYKIYEWYAGGAQHPKPTPFNECNSLSHFGFRE